MPGRMCISAFIYACFMEVVLLGKNGSADETLRQTWFEIKTIMAMPLMCGRAKPFFVSPIVYPHDCLTTMAALPVRKSAAPEPCQHAVHRALEWMQMLANDKSLTMAKIARSHGFTRARVTQIMNLRHLPKEILDRFRRLNTPEELRPFSERKLRRLLSLGTVAEQIQEFAKLQKAAHF